MTAKSIEKQVVLCRSLKTSLAGEFSWFVANPRPGAALIAYSPKMAGDASLKACETWLANKGYKPISDFFPDSFVYEHTPKSEVGK